MSILNIDICDSFEIAETRRRSLRSKYRAARYSKFKFTSRIAQDIENIDAYLFANADDAKDLPTVFPDKDGTLKPPVCVLMWWIEDE